MTQNDQLSASVSSVSAKVDTLTTNLASLSDEIHSEIADLAAAVAANNSGAVAAAVAQLQATDEKLAALSTGVSGLTGELRADNAPQSPPQPQPNP